MSKSNALVEMYSEAALFIIEETLRSYELDVAESFSQGFDIDGLFSAEVAPLVAGYLLGKGLSLKLIDELCTDEYSISECKEVFEKLVKEKYGV